MYLGRKIGTIKQVIDMELDYLQLGKRIADRRRQMNLKQNALAEYVGISNNYLSSIEGGKSALVWKLLLEYVMHFK